MWREKTIQAHVREIAKCIVSAEFYEIHPTTVTTTVVFSCKTCGRRHTLNTGDHIFMYTWSYSWQRYWQNRGYTNTTNSPPFIYYNHVCAECHQRIEDRIAYIKDKQQKAAQRELDHEVKEYRASVNKATKRLKLAKRVGE